MQARYAAVKDYQKYASVGGGEYTEITEEREVSGCAVAVLLLFLWRASAVAVLWLWLWLCCDCAVAVLWLYCGYAVVVTVPALWLCCGCAVAALWLCCLPDRPIARAVRRSLSRARSFPRPCAVRRCDVLRGPGAHCLALSRWYIKAREREAHERDKDNKDNK